MEKRRFALPIACSLGLHALLILGFNNPASLPAPHGNNTRPTLPVVAPPKPEDVFVPVDIDSSERNIAEPLPKQGGPRPEQTEYVGNPKPGDIVIDVDVPHPGPIGPTNTITEIGIPGGDPNGVLNFKAPSRVVDARSLDHTPATRFQPAPDYPREARHDGLKGEVIVEFVVSESGNVYEVNILSSSARMFEEPTLRAVSRWRFEPGRRNGHVVPFRMRQPISFSINSD
jgi:protein TonB